MSAPTSPQEKVRDLVNGSPRLKRVRLTPLDSYSECLSVCSLSGGESSREHEDGTVSTRHSEPLDLVRGKTDWTVFFQSMRCCPPHSDVDLALQCQLGIRERQKLFHVWNIFTQEPSLLFWKKGLDAAYLIWPTTFCPLSKGHHSHVTDSLLELTVSGGSHILCQVCDSGLNRTVHQPRSLEEHECINALHRLCFENHPQFAWNQLYLSRTDDLWRKLTTASTLDCLEYLSREEVRARLISRDHSKILSALLSNTGIGFSANERKRCIKLLFDNRRLLWKDQMLPSIRLTLLPSREKPVSELANAVMQHATTAHGNEVGQTLYPAQFMDKTYSYIQSNFPGKVDAYSYDKDSVYCIHPSKHRVLCGAQLKTPDSDLEYGLQTTVDNQFQTYTMSLDEYGKINKEIWKIYREGEEYERYMNYLGIQPSASGGMGSFTVNITQVQVNHFNSSSSLVQEKTLDMYRELSSVNWGPSPPFTDSMLAHLAAAIEKFTPEDISIIAIYYMFDPQDPSISVAYDYRQMQFYGWDAKKMCWEPVKPKFFKQMLPKVMKSLMNEIASFLPEGELRDVITKFGFEFDMRERLKNEVAEIIGMHIVDKLEDMGETDRLDKMVFNTTKGRVRLLDGIYNIETGILEPVQRNFFDTRCIPHRLKEVDSTEEAEAYLREMFCNHEDEALNDAERDFFLYRVSKKFFNDALDRIIYWMQGVKGTSKTTLMNHIKNALGSSWFYSIPSGIFDNHKGNNGSPQLFTMRDKAIANADEGITASIKDIQSLNAVSGWDNMSIKLLGSNKMEEMQFRGSIFLQSNEYDVARHFMSYPALRDRIEVQIFKKEFIKSDHWRPEYSQEPRRYALRELDVAHKYPQLDPQLLLLILRKCTEWYALPKRELPVPPTMEEYKNHVIEQVSPVHCFVSRYLEYVPCQDNRMAGEITTVLYEYFKVIVETSSHLDDKKNEINTMPKFTKKIKEICNDPLARIALKHEPRNVVSTLYSEMGLEKRSSGFVGIKIKTSALPVDESAFQIWYAQLQGEVNTATGGKAKPLASCTVSEN
jgi:hypothetical protein